MPTKPLNRFFDFTCQACGTRHHIVRALALTCPACEAIPGEMCFDLRSSNRNYRVTVHPERDALIKAMDKAS